MMPDGIQLPHLNSSVPSPSQVFGASGGDDKHFFAFLRIDGIPFTARNVCPNKTQASIHFHRLCHCRNVNVPTENMVVAALYEVGVDITYQQSIEFEEKNKHMKEVKGWTAPEDVDSSCPNRILYEAIH
jgi:hypothetical protein